jgi:hypothetical protein
MRINEMKLRPLIQGKEPNLPIDYEAGDRRDVLDIMEKR